jgi:hypothetical protein
MLLPAGTIYCGTRKHQSSIGEVQHVYLLIFAQASNVDKGYGLPAEATASPFFRMA